MAIALPVRAAIDDGLSRVVVRATGVRWWCDPDLDVLQPAADGIVDEAPKRPNGEPATAATKGA